MQHLKWDGIVGLAFSTPEQRSSGRKSLIDTLAEKVGRIRTCPNDRMNCGHRES